MNLYHKNGVVINKIGIIHTDGKDSEFYKLVKLNHQHENPITS